MSVELVMLFTNMICLRLREVKWEIIQEQQQGKGHVTAWSQSYVSIDYFSLALLTMLTLLIL